MDTETTVSSRLKQAIGTALALRRRRARFINSAILGEPSWDLMLCLGLEGDAERGPTKDKLAQDTAIPGSSAQRWLKILVIEGLVSQHSVEDGDESYRLTEAGWQALIGSFCECAAS